MKKVIGFILLFIFSFTIISCGKNTEEFDGKYSIYLLAKEKGYEGTYDEWVASLKGDEIVLAVDNNQLKWKYSKEDNSAYRTLIALSNLKGADGTNGVDGKTPYIGEDGNWYIDDECLDVKASPKEVKEISSAIINGKTVFTFLFDDDTTIESVLKPEKEPIREVTSIDKEINVYKAFDPNTFSKYYDVYLNKPEFQLGKYNLKFVEEESLVPYISLWNGEII